MCTTAQFSINAHTGCIRAICAHRSSLIQQQELPLDVELNKRMLIFACCINSCVQELVNTAARADTGRGAEQAHAADGEVEERS